MNSNEMNSITKSTQLCNIINGPSTWAGGGWSQHEVHIHLPLRLLHIDTSVHVSVIKELRRDGEVLVAGEHRHGKGYVGFWNMCKLDYWVMKVRSTEKEIRTHWPG